MSDVIIWFRRDLRVSDHPALAAAADEAAATGGAVVPLFVVDDALWAEFRGLQDQFFNARQATLSEQDAEFKANLEAKEELLGKAEAEGLTPNDYLVEELRTLAAENTPRSRAAAPIARTDSGSVCARSRSRWWCRSACWFYGT